MGGEKPEKLGKQPLQTLDEERKENGHEKFFKERRPTFSLENTWEVRWFKKKSAYRVMIITITKQLFSEFKIILKVHIRKKERIFFIF